MTPMQRRIVKWLLDLAVQLEERDKARSERQVHRRYTSHMNPEQRQYAEFQASLQRDQLEARHQKVYHKDTGSGTSLMASLGRRVAQVDKVRQHIEYRRHLTRISARGNTSKLDLRGKGHMPHGRPKESDI
jgi:predicted sugar kinase